MVTKQLINKLNLKNLKWFESEFNQIKKAAFNAALKKKR
jgi:hypothetical protein